MAHHSKFQPYSPMSPEEAERAFPLEVCSIASQAEVDELKARVAALETRMSDEVRQLLDTIKAEREHQHTYHNRPLTLICEVADKAIAQVRADVDELKAAVTELGADIEAEMSRGRYERATKGGKRGPG